MDDIALLLLCGNLAISNWYQLKTKRSRLKDLYTNSPQKSYLKNPGLRSGTISRLNDVIQSKKFIED